MLQYKKREVRSDVQSMSAMYTTNKCQSPILQWFNNAGETKYTQLQVKIKKDNIENFSLDMVNLA